MVGLDPHAIKALKKLFLELKKSGTSLLISTHMLNSVEDYWLKELQLPYIYMIPQSSFKKLIIICLNNLYKLAFETIIITIFVSIFLNSSINEIIGFLIARISFGVLLMAVNIVAQRVLGSIQSKVIVIFLYLAILSVLLIPEIIIAAIIGTATNSIFIALLFLTLWNFGFSLLLTFVSKDILNYAELNNR